VVSDVEEAMVLCRMLGLDKASTFRRQRTNTWGSEEISTQFDRGEILLALFAFPFSCCLSHCCSGFCLERLRRYHTIAGLGLVAWALGETSEVTSEGATT